MKVATTLEQSEELLDLGIPQETADMFYQVPTSMSIEEMIGPFPLNHEYTIIPGWHPAWSMNALSELVKPFNLFYEDGVWYCLRKSDYIGGERAWIVRDGDTAFEALYKAVQSYFWSKKCSKTYRRK
jgi:hypothetical protein